MIKIEDGDERGQWKFIKTDRIYIKLKGKCKNITGLRECLRQEAEKRQDKVTGRKEGRKKNEEEEGEQRERRGRTERGRQTQRERERRPPPGNWLEVNRRGRDNYRCIVGFVGTAI